MLQHWFFLLFPILMWIIHRWFDEISSRPAWNAVKGGVTSTAWESKTTNPGTRNNNTMHSTKNCIFFEWIRSTITTLRREARCLYGKRCSVWVSAPVLGHLRRPIEWHPMTYRSSINHVYTRFSIDTASVIVDAIEAHNVCKYPERRSGTVDPLNIVDPLNLQTETGW